VCFRRPCAKVLVHDRNWRLPLHSSQANPFELLVQVGAAATPFGMLGTHPSEKVTLFASGSA
jgi:hypothetical protein